MAKEEFTYDPLEMAQKRLEREHYVDSLFHPVYGHTPPERQWLVEGLIPKGYLVLLAAEPKKGKSCLATALALAIATGTPFAGIPTHQSAVLWLSLEESPEERRQILKLSPLVDTTTPLYTCYEHLPIDDEGALDAISDWITKTEAGLIVVDPLHGATSGRSLSDGWAARKTLKDLKRMCAFRNVSALVLHHSQRPSLANPRPRVAESAQLAAVASMQMVLTSREIAPAGPQASCLRSGTKTSRLITLHCQGRGEFANRTLHLLSNGPLDYYLVDTDGLARQPEPVRTGYLERQVLTLLEHGPANSDTILTALQAVPGSLRNALTRLRAKGMVSVAVNDESVRMYGLVRRETFECTNATGSNND